MNSCVGLPGLPRNRGMITPVAIVGWSDTGSGLRVASSIPEAITGVSLVLAIAFLNSSSFSGYGEVVRMGTLFAPFLPKLPTITGFRDPLLLSDI